MVKHFTYRNMQKVTPKGDQCCKYPCSVSGKQDTMSFRTIFCERLPKLNFGLKVRPSSMPLSVLYSVGLKTPYLVPSDQIHYLTSLSSLVRRYCKVSEYAWIKKAINWISSGEKSLEGYIDKFTRRKSLCHTGHCI